MDALSIADNGHSFLITGSCGTGKTYTLRYIVNCLAKSKNVAVTATTGMASLQLGLHATTLHHWAGIGDGRNCLSKLSELFDNDDNYASAKKRIFGTDCLVIDEISMLSQKVFEMVEFVCRHVRQNSLCFGGIQVIGCGDFKQLPPVPDKYLNDSGEYCFKSPLFNVAFPHHVRLTKVIRQQEADLATAVQELCDGSPSDATLELMKSLNVTLDVPDDQVTRLYGTNFDVRFINEEMLDAFTGDAHVFKAKDEGKREILLRSPVPKTLLLKEGAPVILVKNIAGRLFNGQRGTVYKLQDGSPPVINFNGALHSLKPERFEVFDASENKVLAARLQIPVILCFAMTVHRAQGQTINNLEIDCSSFFSPGQMGVAVGRAVCKKGLSVRNFNMTAATLKHPESVYVFDEQPFKSVEADLSCCSRHCSEHTEIVNDQYQSFSDSDTLSDTEGDYTNSDTDKQYLPCPFKVQEFIDINQSAEFVKLLSAEFIASDDFLRHKAYIYCKVSENFKSNAATNSLWMQSYKNLNDFLIGKEHLESIRKLFKIQHVSKLQNKFSSKLSFWMMEKLIAANAESIITHQTTQCSSNVPVLSEAGLAKLRYIAGACVHKIRNRLRGCVERNIVKTGKMSKLTRKLSYQKQHLLKSLTVTEDSIDISDPSMSEVTAKQNKSHGLTIINDKCLEFFKNLNSLLQSVLHKEKLHLNLGEMHNFCRNIVDSDISLLNKWICLFSSIDAENIEDEILLELISELYQTVTDHFVKLSLVDSLKEFKRSIPRKKKQALRTKIQALGERDKTKRPKTDTNENICVCPMCKNVCEEEPVHREGSSIGCDKCNNWYHYGCVNLSGNEPFLKSNSNWFCSSCSKRGKGKGKKTKK